MLPIDAACRFSSSLGKRDRRIPPDRLPPVVELEDEGLGSAMGHSAAECSKARRRVPIVHLAGRRRPKLADREVCEKEAHEVLPRYLGTRRKGVFPCCGR